MEHIEAVYRHGVFQPLGPVNLREEQRVRLHVVSASEESPQSWLNRVQQLQAAVVQRNGQLPDSAPDIAADRLR